MTCSMLGKSQTDDFKTLPHHLHGKLAPKIFYFSSIWTIGFKSQVIILSG